MALPPLPESYEGNGYDFMERLTGGWYAVDIWGSEGWDLGGWPHQAIMHYDGQTFGYCSFTEGDLDVKEFATSEERDHATDEYFVWFNEFHDVPIAPRKMTSGRLGPYRR